MKGALVPVRMSGKEWRITMNEVHLNIWVMQVAIEWSRMARHQEVDALQP